MTTLFLKHLELLDSQDQKLAPSNDKATSHYKMSALNSAPLVVTGKRKRATVSYAEVEDELDMPDGDDAQDDSADATAITMIDDDDDDDDDFTTSKKKAKKAKARKKAKKTQKTPKIPKAPKEKAFNFLGLPGELRDMIYEMTLVDPNGVSLIANTRYYRQVAHRGAVYRESSYRYPSHRSRGLKKNAKQVAQIATQFVPALLALNKQVNAEAINYLYGHDFYFENTTALNNFLATIGSTNMQRLASIEILAWGHKHGVSRANNSSSLTLLGGATSLKKLAISCNISYHNGSPHLVARHFFESSHRFLEAYGSAKGRKDAAVNIIKMRKSAFQWQEWTSRPSDEEIQQFKTELRNMLGVVTATKKSKSFK